MKKGRLFGAIVYFIFTFAIGILLALTLPNAFAAFSIPSEYTIEQLQQGNYSNAMMLVGHCFNKQPFFVHKFDENSGLVLFETVMQNQLTDEDDKPASDGLANGMLYRTYMGFLYGDEETYDVYKESSNKTALVVEYSEGEVSLPILDYDSDGDGVNDGLSTWEQYGIVVVDIPQYLVPAVKNLTFLDKDGNTPFGTVTLPQEHTFNEEFFSFFDVDDFNATVKRLNDTLDGNELTQLQNDLRQKLRDMIDAANARNPNYVAVDNNNESYQGVMDEISSRANRKAIPIIVVYFVVIYVIADFLLGSHFIIKFFNWFLFKVCRIPRKGKKAPNKDEVFGHDYYSMVTFKLDTSAVPSFVGSVEIKYTNSDREIVFNLLNSDNYTATQRVKAGTYVNPFIDINRAYAAPDLPDNLIVEGYRMEQVVHIVSRSPSDASQQPPTENSEQSD